jgi:tRNA(Leu) C34 or U34 (ribose-2'-O)-methylase TrmL
MMIKNPIVRPGMGADVAVALFNPKYAHNVGGAVRAASCFGLEQVWFSGNRVSLDGSDGARIAKTSRTLPVKQKKRLPREERMKGYAKVTLAQADYFFDAFDADVVPVGIEIRENSESLITFEHPEKALYVFGPEDGSLGRAQLLQCHRVVQIPMAHCANLSSAVYMVLFHRHMTRVLAGLEEPIAISEGRGWIEPDSMVEEVGVS